MTRISVILTCFNRKEKTIACLKSLLKSESVISGKYELQFFVCDDCSTDGTSEAIHELSKEIHIIKGTGDLFWARGMAKAMEGAEKVNTNFYLMVNDDVEFFSEMLDVMMESYFSIDEEMIAVVGSTRDKHSGDHTYGGWMWNGKALKGESIPVLPVMPCRECNQTNWNCFLLPKKLYDIVGKIDSHYEHSWADFDYSNRLIRCGYKIYVAYDYIGTCSRNSENGTWSDKSLSVKDRIKALHKKTGLPPKSHWYYCRKYYGLEALPMFLRPYLSIIKNSIIKKG